MRTRVIYDLKEGQFSRVLQEAGELYAVDKVLITVHPSGASVIHQCESCPDHRTEEEPCWRFLSEHEPCECGQEADPRDWKRARAIARCGK